VLLVCHQLLMISLPIPPAPHILMYVYIYMYTFTHVHACTYIHTHTHKKSIHAIAVRILRPDIVTKKKLGYPVTKKTRIKEIGGNRLRDSTQTKKKGSTVRSGD